MGVMADLSAQRAAEGLEEAALNHGLKMVRRCIKFLREAKGHDGARYMLAEYLKKQGVRADLIPYCCQKVEEHYGLK